ncbi:hypothetical protein [Lichenibacterium dinghuense]|uniref:hypothetical protein n=1 Tax=Lichenibacterium dinghuense TaxID=2895977 RepID=UPI001F1E2989|nr:hypothetical protein [Lichenibacterium sp. 6Y81]
MIARRGFLRTLAGLPLVGGSIALVGEPTAAAVPVTDALRDRYVDWLATELGHTLIERDGLRAEPKWRDFVIDHRREWCRTTHVLNPDPTSERFRLLPAVPPSSRAAVTLSAAGVPLVGGLGRG